MPHLDARKREQSGAGRSMKSPYPKSMTQTLLQLSVLPCRTLDTHHLSQGSHMMSRVTICRTFRPLHFRPIDVLSLDSRYQVLHGSKRLKKARNPPRDRTADMGSVFKTPLKGPKVQSFFSTSFLAFLLQPDRKLWAL